MRSATRERARKRSGERAFKLLGCPELLAQTKTSCTKWTSGAKRFGPGWWMTGSFASRDSRATAAFGLRPVDTLSATSAVLGVGGPLASKGPRSPLGYALELEERSSEPYSSCAKNRANRGRTEEMGDSSMIPQRAEMFLGCVVLIVARAFPPIRRTFRHVLKLLRFCRF